MYVHAGTGSVVTKDRTYPIEKNALFLIKPGTYHYTMPDRPDDYVRSKLLLSSGDRTQIESLLSAHKDFQQFFDHTVIYAQIPQTLNSEINHISLELDLDNICAAATMSKYHFCRQFKVQLGMTVMQYHKHQKTP